MNNFIQKTIFASTMVLAFGIAATAQTAPASTTPASTAPANGNQGNWDKEHPRRAEVNNRLNNQSERVAKKEADGKMSAKEAEKINRQDEHIRNQERKDAKANGGHITKAEQKQLNKEENHVSKEIKRH